jgi:hypothetical protein
MSRLLGLLRGFPGHPAHPPFTDATIGSFTLGTILVLASWLGLAESETVTGGMLALAVGLVLAVPTIVTGLIDYLDIPRGTARWRPFWRSFTPLTRQTSRRVSGGPLAQISGVISISESLIPAGGPAG